LWVWLQAQNGQKQITFFWISSVFSCSEKWRLFNLRNCQKTEDLIQLLCTTQRTEQQTVSNQNRKRSRRPRYTTEQEDNYIRVSSLRNRRRTSPQLAASLNSTLEKIAFLSKTRTILRHPKLLNGIVYNWVDKAAYKQSLFCFLGSSKMQVFQPSSVLSVVVRQASVLRRDWLSILSLMGTLRHHQV
jgi:hypothetical protein